MGYWLENKMNKGDVVICIVDFSDTKIVSLTYGKSYTVLDSTKHTILIMDDNGVERQSYIKESFSLLSEWRYNKLKSINV
jgi:histidinol phosphatase-like enzyme